MLVVLDPDFHFLPNFELERTKIHFLDDYQISLENVRDVGEKSLLVI